MTRSNWITLIATVVALVLIACFATNIWHAIEMVGHWIGILLWFLWEAFAGIMRGLWNLILLGLDLAMPVLTVVVAFVMVLAAIAVGIGLLMMLSLMVTGYIGGKLKEIGQQVRELRVEFRVESGRAGRDAAFLALITAICGLVAFMGTEEFLRHMSTVRFLAISCIGLVVAKIFLFFPSRIPKLSGIFLTIVILVGSILFVAIRYGLADSNGLVHLREVVMDPENQLKLLLAVIIALFSLLTLLFPFTGTEWRQLLVVPRSQLPDPSAAKLSHTVALGQGDLAQIEHKQA